MRPQTRIDLLARTLAASGATVTVHTGFPHYPGGRIPAPYRNRPWLREHRDGISILRTAVYPPPTGASPVASPTTPLSPLSALATARLSGPADVVIGETPPLFTAAAAVAYAAAKHAALSSTWPTAGPIARSSSASCATAGDRRRLGTRAAGLPTGTADHAPTEGIVDALADFPRSAPRPGASGRSSTPSVSPD